MQHAISSAKLISRFHNERRFKATMATKMSHTNFLRWNFLLTCPQVKKLRLDIFLCVTSVPIMILRQGFEINCRIFVAEDSINWFKRCKWAIETLVWSAVAFAAEVKNDLVTTTQVMIKPNKKSVQTSCTILNKLGMTCFSCFFITATQMCLSDGKYHNFLSCQQRLLQNARSRTCCWWFVWQLWLRRTLHLEPAVFQLLNLLR